MKIKISYKHDGTASVAHSAFTTVGGQYISGWGDSFKEAKARLLERLTSLFGDSKVDLPPDEEIEIDE